MACKCADGGAGLCRPGGSTGAAAVGPAVLVRVWLGQVPRDASPDEGLVVPVDAETARRLVAVGAAVLVAERAPDGTPAW